MQALGCEVVPASHPPRIPVGRCWGMRGGCQAVPVLGLRLAERRGKQESSLLTIANLSPFCRFAVLRMTMLLGAFPDAIAPGSDAAEAIVQEKYNPKLVSTLVRGCERAVHAPRSRMTNVRRAALLFA